MRTVKPKFFVNLFIYKRLRNQRYKKYVEKPLVKFLTNNSVCLRNAKIHSHCKPDELISSISKNTKSDCKHASIKVGTRFIVKPKSWHLPSNRYTLPGSLGANGGFISKLPRTEQTIISHNCRMKELGEFRYYDKISFIDKQNNKCCYFKGIFTSNPRARRPTSRSMIRDLNYAVSSPLIGPGTYCPKIISFGKQDIKKEKPLFIYKFYNYTSVPVTENTVGENATYFGSDPTAYYPYHTTKCPIPGKCDPDIAYRIEVNNRNKSRRLPYNRQLLHLPKIETAFDKNIKGHGHVSRFICPANCQNPKVFIKHITKELEYNFLSLDYLKMITNPNRKIISFRDSSTKLIPKPIIIKYMATYKVVIRKKLLDTPNLAFNSTQPRWKDDKTKIVIEKPKEHKQKNKKKIIKKEIKSRVYDIKRTELDRNISKLMTYKFSKEPPSKLLIPSNYIGDFGTQQLKYFLDDLPSNNFVKNMYLT